MGYIINPYGRKVDGEKIKGTLKIPRDMLTSGEHILTIERKDTINHPVLLEAINAYVKEVTVENTTLKFQIEDKGRIPIKFYSPWIARVEMDGKLLPVFWNSTGIGMIWIELEDRESIGLIISCRQK